MATSEEIASVELLMVETSKLNVILAEAGWPLITLPQLSAPIQPFFVDMAKTIERLRLEMESRIDP